MLGWELAMNHAGRKCAASCEHVNRSENRKTAFEDTNGEQFSTNSDGMKMRRVECKENNRKETPNIKKRSKKGDKKRGSGSTIERDQICPDTYLLNLCPIPLVSSFRRYISTVMRTYMPLDWN
jgi:hypothetical protein